MDPLADKLLVTAALCVLVGAGKTSVWVLFIIIVREFVVTGLRLIAVDNGVVIAASMWGKVKTVLQSSSSQWGFCPGISVRHMFCSRA